MKKTTITLAALCITMSAWAQSPVNKISYDDMLGKSVRRGISMPDIAGYKTLKGDFHLHTIYSDGEVLPSTRVREAYENGLDVIAITDHQIQQQNIGKVGFDDNTSFDHAQKAVKDYPIILIKGTEITYGKEDGGHMNALFIKDANPINKPTMAAAVDEAAAQGAFLIWNHPGWAIDTCKFFGPNEKWMKEGKIHGVEVFNEKEFYPRVVTWCGEYGFAPFANTDAHSAIRGTYNDVFPYTLVFVKDADVEGVREAMFDRRTVAVFNGQMAGDAKYLSALMEASLKFKHTRSDDQYDWYEVTNVSDVPYVFRSRGFNLTVPAGAAMQFNFDKGVNVIDVNVMNLHTAEFTPLKATLKLK